MVLPTWFSMPKARQQVDSQTVQELLVEMLLQIQISKECCKYPQTTIYRWC